MMYIKLPKEDKDGERIKIKYQINLIITVILRSFDMVLYKTVKDATKNGWLRQEFSSKQIMYSSFTET